MKLFTMGKFAAVTLLALGLSAAGAENLVPKFEQVASESTDGWVTNRAKIEATFAIDAATKTLTLAPTMETQGGYADWRFFAELKPGEYTLAARFTGKDAGLSVNVYSFNADGKPSLILSRSVTAPANNTLFIANFKIPADSAKVRIGFTVSKISSWQIINPALFAGKVADPGI